MSTRRAFLTRTGTAVAAAAAAPELVFATAVRGNDSHETLDRLGERVAARQTTDEEFWRFVRSQFPVRDDLVLMNAANLCPSPFPVQQRVFELTQDVDRDASFQNRGKFDGLAEASRTSLARMMGCDADEVAIVRNTSAANATVVNGLELGPGDEVVLWDENHPTNNIAWDVRAEREGFIVRKVATPPGGTSADGVLAAFAAHIGPRTRVVSFSHVSNVSGVAVPAKELCAMAHEAGAFAMIDGAQTFGALRVNLHELGCDAYTGSCHKWFVGPKEAGLLYVRREWHDRMWATHVGVGWDAAVEAGARKFEVLGQRDDAAVAAVDTAVRFHETIGINEVEARVRELAGMLREGIADAAPGTVFHAPEPSRSAGVVVFTLPGVDNHGPVFERMYAEFGIAGAPQGRFNGFRLCPHVYNTAEQVERVVEAVRAVS